MQRLLIRQAPQVMEEAFHLLLDGRILLIGANDVFALPPQGIYRVQLRRPLRQPQQHHPFGCPQRGLRGVARILIQQQRHMPTPLRRAHLGEDRLEVIAAPLRARQQQPCPRPQVHRPKAHAPSVAAAQPDLGGVAALRPSGTQRRKEQQVRFVLGQHDAAARQGPNVPADAAFFSRAPGQDPDRDAAACRRNPAGAESDAGYLRTPVVR